jgi:hypothetical protein
MKWIYRGLGACVAGFSVPSAYSAGAAFSPAGSWLGIATGTAGVGVVGAGVALLPCATKCFGRREWFRGLLLSAAWAVAFSAVLYSSIGNVSTVRGDTVAEKSDVISKYEQATADVARLKGDRDAATKSPLWESSAHCTQLDHKSRSFCERLAGIGLEIDTKTAIVNAGHPGAADPQAATVAWFLHLPQDVVAKASPMLIAAAFEITAMGLFFASEMEHEDVSQNEQPPPPAEPPLEDIAILLLRAQAERDNELYDEAAAEKAATKRKKARESRQRKRLEATVKAKPKRRRRRVKKRQEPRKPPALSLVR